MNVTLLHNTPLWVAAVAIRTAWQSFDKSDTITKASCRSCGFDFKLQDDESDEDFTECVKCGYPTLNFFRETGEKDKELIDRVGNKYKHSSTLESLTYNFYIKGISRACLQELARHRMASLTVKSTRYTLKELRSRDYVTWDTAKEFIVFTGDNEVDRASVLALQNLQELVKSNKSNDIAKFALPESYKTELTWTINARSLQNFLALRTDKSAMWEIRELAYKVYEALPEDHKYLFKECIKGDKNDE